MRNYTLSAEKLDELRKAHRCAHDKRSADRIKAVTLLATDWSAEQVAEVLQIDPNTTRNHFSRYLQGGLDLLLQVNYHGSDCLLDNGQLARLDAHLQKHLYLTAKAVADWVKRIFSVSYTESGMTALLHRLGYVYKKPKLVPGKASAEEQKDFLAKYKNIKENKGKHDPLYFMDAVHPQHNPIIACGWIKRGQTQEIKSNTGRKRVNINGAINLDDLEPVVIFDNTINSFSTITLLNRLKCLHPLADKIYVICDNAPYYRSEEMREYLKGSKIELVFLPTYSPNLNLIERLWKFFKKNIIYNEYYESFDQFKAACRAFFSHPHQYRDKLRTLLTENFEIIGG